MGKTVLEDLNNSQDSVYIIGTTENSVKKAVSNFLDLYPSINLIGYRNGYFINEDERNLVIDNMVSLNPSFVIVGMGTPTQENFLIKLKEAGWRGTGFTCGGFLHQSAKNVVYYPKWINLLNIRWIYRIWDEPKLITRYFVQYPIASFL
ncbi:WecB/TagA/CpsF family glycosyltransferase, partial [Fulvivirga lutimaris]|uniref:WecB/TagA/CpsF family glycosyltransferase n=1 Tax=Fulvivirga lutimaris TaxID=1819566 RepID=UPI001624A72B